LDSWLYCLFLTFIVSLVFLFSESLWWWLIHYTAIMLSVVNTF
jgi:hypothetical protein